MPSTTDVVVLGAGSAGCAVAYYLAREGIGVTVVEREAIGSCASGCALGLLNPFIGTKDSRSLQDLTEIGFRMHVELWPLLRDEAEMDIQARLMPHVQLCLDTEDVSENQEEMKRWSQADGFEARWLEPKDILALVPGITNSVKGAVLLENVGMLDCYRYTLALARAAERYGAKFLTAEVVGLHSMGNRVTGVKLGRGDLECNSVVVAMGPWSGRATEWLLGVNIPVGPLKGQIIYLEGFEPPLAYNLTGSCTLAHKLDGMVWVAATTEDVGFDNGTTNDARDLLIQRALSMIPSLSEHMLIQQTACLRPVAPDHHPVIGKVPGWDHVFLATGAEKKGILISPPVGQAVADLIIKKETSIPIADFSLERFMT